MPPPTTGCNNSCRCCAFTKQVLRAHHEAILRLNAELEDLKDEKRRTMDLLEFSEREGCCSDS